MGKTVRVHEKRGDPEKGKEKDYFHPGFYGHILRLAIHGSF